MESVQSFDLNRKFLGECVIYKNVRQCDRVELNNQLNGRMVIVLSKM